MDQDDEIEGRVQFGADVDAAIRHWGGYDTFPDGFVQVHRVLTVLEEHLGAVDSTYSLGSGGYAAIRLRRLPSVNALTTGVGFVYVSPSALRELSNAGVDLRQRLREAKLDVHPDPEAGITVWNAQGRRDIDRVANASQRRVCPSCFLQWFGDTCPDCGVPLT